MNLQRLLYLTEVADGPTLSAAARRLHISQPVLSRAIRLLERELGVSLVELRGRSLHIREDAEPIVEAARQALDAVQRISQTATRLREPVLTIAATRNHQSLLASVLPLLTARTGAAIRLRAAVGSDDVLRAIRSGRADVGFGEAVVVGDDMAATIVGEIALVLAARRGTNLPNPVELARCGPLPLVAVAERERWALLMQAIAVNGGSVKTVLEVGDRSTMLKAVEAGVGFAVGTRSVVAANPNLELFALEPPIRYQVAAIRLRHSTTAVGTLVDVLTTLDWR
ncbi:LysR family transcriptional regulator [Yinghuangia sp. ASG 101]|uniref:LysR family transcriptional regulator n=1 Tax=Yinghuangia sp. ASG 101 TaxID=2896848 RepID=UPI001E5F646D|nr:LysR family transcriptional regulator [Yinghuangia sp. ASG 101]UGQ10986.1 LysR family transcriptional regulator [Yinghuangia sp. ASG 101]